MSHHSKNSDFCQNLSTVIVLKKFPCIEVWFDFGIDISAMPTTGHAGKQGYDHQTKGPVMVVLMCCVSEHMSLGSILALEALFGLGPPIADHRGPR